MLISIKNGAGPHGEAPRIQIECAPPSAMQAHLGNGTPAGTGVPRFKQTAIRETALGLIPGIRMAGPGDCGR